MCCGEVGGSQEGREQSTHGSCSHTHNVLWFPPTHTDRAESAPPPPMMLWVSHRGWKQGAPRRHPAGQDHALLGTPRLRESTAAPTCCHSHMHLYFSAPPSAVLHNLLWQKKQTKKKTQTAANTFAELLSYQDPAGRWTTTPTSVCCF